MGMAIASNNIGYVYNNFKVDIPKAIDYYKKSIEYLKDIEANDLVANLLNNLAYVYHNQGDYKRALAMFFDALKLHEQAKEMRGLGEVYNNIGAVYQDLDDPELAREFYLKSLEIRMQIPDSVGMSYNYNNLAALYMENEDYHQSMNYHKYALSIREQLNRPNLLAESYGNIGLIYIYLKEYDSAFLMLDKAIKVNQELGDESAEAAVLGNLGLMNLKKGNFNQSLKYAYKSFEISTNNDFAKYKRTSSDLLYQSYKKLYKSDSALKYFEISVALKDSSMTEDNIRESIKLKTRYEIEKEELIKKQELEEAQKKAAALESRRNSIQYTLILISLLVLAVIILSLGWINVTPRQAQGLIFLSILIFFEFLLVLTDPYVDVFSGGAPIIKLGVNALVAALIFPLHNYLENRLKKRVMKKKSNVSESN
jgi:tetratricopeptide (TPR) repeat protein